MMMRKLLNSLLLALALAWMTVSAVTALPAVQEPTPRTPTDDEVNAIAKQMYCPVCENTPLDVCPTQACAEWRELIREKLTEGWNEDQIKEYFVLQYGDRVLATPPARGLNWLVYIIPVVAFAVGVFILYKAIRAYRQPIPQAEPVTPPDAAATASSTADASAKDKYVDRLEEELRKL
jgi:cytochrome c-type biogenesis protein CcmH